MSCECPECSEYSGPDPKVMSLRFLVLAAQSMVALLGLVKERSWKSLGVLLGSIAFFFTLPRYLICARCGEYGKNCHAFYLGRLTSLYIPKAEGKQTSPIGAGLEGLTLALLANTPAVGMRKNGKLLALYLLLSNATLFMHVWHACRHCATYATDWRKSCSGAKFARSVFRIQ